MTPWVTRLLVANVLVFFLTMAVPGLRFTLMLVPAYILLRPWTLITYMFVHAGLMHLFFNMLGLFFFGPRLEARLGGKGFLWLYFISGLMGGILSLFFTPFSAIVGASGAVFGVLLGFARYWPRDQIYIWGVLPVEARWLVVAMTALALFGGFGGSGGNVAHFAHLGGFLGGWLYLKGREWRATLRRMRVQAAMNPTRPSGGPRADLARWRRIRRDQMHEVNRSELDRIMGKIESSGVGSLSPDERNFLDRFSPD